jgi:hypothetical protein
VNKTPNKLAGTIRELSRRLIRTAQQFNTFDIDECWTAVFCFFDRFLPNKSVAIGPRFNIQKQDLTVYYFA